MLLLESKLWSCSEENDFSHLTSKKVPSVVNWLALLLCQLECIISLPSMTSTLIRGGCLLAKTIWKTSSHMAPFLELFRSVCKLFFFFSFGLAAPQSFLYWTTIAQKMPFFPSVNGGDKGRRFSAAARFWASNLLNQVSSVFGLSLVLNGDNNDWPTELVTLCWRFDGWLLVILLRPKMVHQ